MKRSSLYSTAAFIYYGPLLQRYARRIIKDAVAAATIATKLLQEQYEQDGLQIAPNQRQSLKEDIRLRCHYWQQAQLFDHSPEGIPLPKKERLIVDNNNLLNDSSCDATNL